ncbi:hypothetical protein D3C85_1536260 [compost metagenome]
MPSARRITSGAHSVVVCAQLKVSASSVYTLLEPFRNSLLVALTESVICCQRIRSVDLADARWEPNT